MRVGAMVAGLAVALAWSVPPNAQAQTVDEIVAKHIEARGGYGRIKAIESLKITRTVATPFTSVTVVTYKKRPNLLRIEQTPKGQTTAIARGVNADAAWETIQGKILTRPEAAATETREIDGDFDGLLVDWKEKGHAVTLEGREPLGTGEAFKLKVTTKGGATRHVFIDTKTYLESAMSGRIQLPALDPKTGELRMNPGTSTWTYSDYRDVNGVKFPFSVDEERTTGPITQSFATYTEKVEVNVPLEDALFAPPGK